MKKRSVWAIGILTVLMINVQAQQFNSSVTLKREDRSLYDHFGFFVQLRKEVLACGTPEKDFRNKDSSLVTDAGCMYLYERKAKGRWEQTARIFSPEIREFDHFGQAFALYDHGMLVAAPLFDSTDGKHNGRRHAGAVWAYEKSGNNWQMTHRVLPPEDISYSWFGSAVSVDRNIAAISAPLKDYVKRKDTLDYAGAVYLYKRSETGKWQFFQKLISPVLQQGAEFGNSLYLKDGWLFVGEHLADHVVNGGLLKDAGNVYAYKLETNGFFGSGVKINAPDADEEDRFGHTFTMYDDQLFVGAYQEDHNKDGKEVMNNAGSVYVFRKVANAGWQYEAKLTAPQRAVGDLFGYALSVSGPYLAVAAPGKSTEAETGKGANYKGNVFVFRKGMDGKWVFSKQLQPKTKGEASVFGKSVSLWFDKLAIGAYREADDDSDGFKFDAGAVYVFE